MRRLKRIFLDRINKLRLRFGDRWNYCLEGWTNSRYWRYKLDSRIYLDCFWLSYSSLHWDYLERSNHDQLLQRKDGIHDSSNDRKHITQFTHAQVKCCDLKKFFVKSRTYTHFSPSTVYHIFSCWLLIVTLYLILCIYVSAVKDVTTKSPLQCDGFESHKQHWRE